MFDTLLSIIAPHHCSRCGKNGTILCQKCKNYIIEYPNSTCIVCHSPSDTRNFCSRHNLPYGHAWCVSERSGVIQKLIDELKFERKRAVSKVLAEILNERLPELPKETCLVPIPTAPRNIRRRGYDHMLMISGQLAKLRNLETAPLLIRKNNVTQHFAPNAKARHEQAKNFFEISKKHTIKPRVSYVLIDDIFTSGATLKAGATCLREAGVDLVSIIVIARQR